MSDKVRIQVYIDPAARDMLRQIAKETRRNISAAIETIIVEEHARMNRQQPPKEVKTVVTR